MLELLNNSIVWEEFLHYKLSHRLLSKHEEEELRNFIQSHSYERIATSILQHSYHFSIPKKSIINKLGSNRKRIVYTFSTEENWILKFLAYCLHDLDSKFPSNCYAFRCNTGSRQAFSNILNYGDIDKLWCFKSDITNYFNSIDITLLEPMILNTLEDKDLAQLLLSILHDDRALTENGIIHEKKGVMAGTPISSFLANLYLSRMDEYFLTQPVCYIRYSDDIIMFASIDNIAQYRSTYHTFLQEYHLTINKEKEALIAPGNTWSFLGFSYQHGIIDISLTTKNKLMGKMRRTSHSLYRWGQNNKASKERILRAFLKKYNRKLYATNSGHELCWSRWYFPMITTTNTLSDLDHYMQDCLRYSVTGRHNKSNYDTVPYELLKECGYETLVASYYRYKEEVKNLI